jgi:hypothetical protein
MNVPKKVLAKAYRMVAEQLDTDGWVGDDEDTWVSLDKEWDMCLWSDWFSQDMDSTPLRCATIYQVVDGNTQTQTFKRIFESDYVDMEVKV